MMIKVSIWPDMKNYKWPNQAVDIAILAIYDLSISGQNLACVSHFCCFVPHWALNS
jgi:hypothetical protein